MTGREDALYRLTELRDIIGINGLDLLWKLLDVNPNSRLTTAQALKYQFFNDLNNDTEVEEQYDDLSIDSWKMKIDETIEFANLLRSNEEKLRPDPFYMINQSMITESMRAILVDWLVDVSIHFEVMNDTLYYAIAYIDRSLSVLDIPK